jgi:hypothetical protein
MNHSNLIDERILHAAIVRDCIRFFVDFSWSFVECVMGLTPLSTAVATGPATSTASRLSRVLVMVMLVVVQLSVASPRGRHSAGRDVRSILNEDKEFVFIHSLAKLSQYVIVYVSSLATGIEKGACVAEPSHTIVPRKQVSAH